MNGKVVLVTGANGGLGAHITQAFLDSGAIVAGTAREISQSDFRSSKFSAFPADISSLQSARQLIDQVIEIGRASCRERV